MALVGGAVLGTLFNALYDDLRSLIGKNLTFNPLLNDMKSSLDAFKPLIEQIEECNMQGLVAVIEEGAGLFEKCLKVRWWNPFNKYKYSGKLIQWDKSLQLQLDILKVKDMMDGRKTADAVDHLMNIVRLNPYSAASSSRPTPLELPPLPALIVGLGLPLRKMKQKLLTDDGVSTLVLTAPGGCGKTTLATMFCQDEQVKDKFKRNIIFVTVSQKGSLDLIVQQLCDHQGSQVPIFKNEVEVGQWLQRYFVEKRHQPLLLVLDDVWSGSESILGHFQFRMSNYKILVTSRSEFPWFGSSYHLQLLDDGHAMKLFQHSASLENVSSHILQELSTKIVKRCNGFPLAITIVGRSLCQRPIEFWRKTEAEWSKGSSILDSETKLLLCLQSSLDALDDEMVIVKECFLDLGSFPEDYRIPVATLFDMWVELYELDENNMCIANINELRTRSLANLIDQRQVKVEGDDFYDERFVTQHDLLRELAIYQAKLDPVVQRKRVIIEICGNDLPKWWREQKYQPIKARLLSISTDRGFSMEWPDMQLPEAEVLILNFQTKSYALPKFVEKMNKLKVLVLTKDDYESADLRNFELLGSLSNLKSTRFEGISIACITRKPVQLKSLKKISFYKCFIGLSFGNEFVKLSDAFPVLEEMTIQECRHVGNLLPELCDLIYLKTLSITHHSDIEALPEDIGNLVNLEVLRVRSCYDLLKLPKSIGNLKKLKLLDIFNCISIKELPTSIGELSSLRKFDMKWCYKLKNLPLSLLYLNQLEEVICDDDTKYLWDPFKLSLGKTRIVAS